MMGFAAGTETQAWVLAGLQLLLWQMINDGLLADTGQTRPLEFPATFREHLYKLTDEGEAFVKVLREEIQSGQ